MMMKMAEQPKETPAQQYKKLLERAEALKGKAVEQLKAEIAEKITELNEYGFSYRLTDQPETAPAVTKRGRQPGSTAKPQAPAKGYDASKTCQICGGMRGHDGRAHRTHKEPFTAQELAELRLTPPADAATA